ncbi:MAG TPA: hypothetical protein VJU17_03745, partial [Gemmatimonadales bacterium]|nr:hypothetical protein [Gemmatimonadales bacterium]
MQLLDEVARALSQAGDFESAVRVGLQPVVRAFAELIVLVVRREGTEDWLEVCRRDSAQSAESFELLQPLLPAVERVAEQDRRWGRGFRWIPIVRSHSLRFLASEPALLDALQRLKVHTL